MIINKHQLKEEGQIERVLCAIINQSCGGYAFVGLSEQTLIVEGEIIKEK